MPLGQWPRLPLPKRRDCLCKTRDSLQDLPAFHLSALGQAPAMSAGVKNTLPHPLAAVAEKTPWLWGQAHPGVSPGMTSHKRVTLGK